MVPDALRDVFVRAIHATPQQVRIIANATPKREYYYQATSGNRLFELGLGGVSLAAVGSSSPGDQQLISQLLADHDRGEFAERFFAAKGQADVARYLGGQRRAAYPRVA